MLFITLLENYYAFITQNIVLSMCIQCNTHTFQNDITSVAEDANDKHLCAWADICARYQLGHTPLEPVISQELLLNKHLNLNGNKLRDLGFICDVPTPTTERLREVIICNTFTTFTYEREAEKCDFVCMSCFNLFVKSGVNRFCSSNRLRHASRLI